MSNIKLNKDVNKIVQRPRITKSPKIVKAQRINQPASTGRGALSASDSDSSGIDSPLTEMSRVEETFDLFDDFNVWSVNIINITQLTMEDASGREVVFNFVPQDPDFVP